jgi:hypothetical protein
MNPNKKDYLRRVLSPLADIKAVRSFIESHQFHDIAPPHNPKTCEQCIAYRELTK